MDMQGKLMFEHNELMGTSFQTELELPKAIYLLHLVHEKGQRSFKLTYQ